MVVLCEKKEKIVTITLLIKNSIIKVQKEEECHGD